MTSRRGHRQRLESQSHPLVAAATPGGLRGDQAEGGDGSVQGIASVWSDPAGWCGADLGGSTTVHGHHPRRRDQSAVACLGAVDPGFRPQRRPTCRGARRPLRRISFDRGWVGRLRPRACHADHVGRVGVDRRSSRSDTRPLQEGTPAIGMTGIGRSVGWSTSPRIWDNGSRADRGSTEGLGKVF